MNATALLTSAEIGRRVLVVDRQLANEQDPNKREVLTAKRKAYFTDYVDVLNAEARMQARRSSDRAKRITEADAEKELKKLQ